VFRIAKLLAFACAVVFLGAYLDSRKAAAAGGQQATCDNNCHNILIGYYCGSQTGFLWTYKSCTTCRPVQKALCSSGLSAGQNCLTPLNGYKENLAQYGTTTAICDCNDASNPAVLEATSFETGTGELGLGQLVCQ
jgi:hypothetical protein